MYFTEKEFEDLIKKSNEISSVLDSSELCLALVALQHNWDIHDPVVSRLKRLKRNAENMELNDFQKSKYYYEHFYKPIRAITKCYDPQDENQKHKNNHEKENGDQNKRTIKRYVKENKINDELKYSFNEDEEERSNLDLNSLNNSFSIKMNIKEKSSCDLTEMTNFFLNKNKESIGKSSVALDQNSVIEWPISETKEELQICNCCGVKIHKSMLFTNGQCNHQFHFNCFKASVIKKLKNFIHEDTIKIECPIVECKAHLNLSGVKSLFKSLNLFESNRMDESSLSEYPRFKKINSPSI